MKKSIGWLSLVMFIFVTLFAGSAFADLTDLNWFVVQKRKYEGEEKITRVSFGVAEGQHSDVQSVRLFYWEDGSGWTQLPQVGLADFSSGIVEKYSYINYDYYKFGRSLNIWDWNMGLSPPGCNSGCDVVWQSEGDSFNANFAFDDFEPVDNTHYQIEVNWADSGTGNSGVLTKGWFFTEEVDLPDLSLAKGRDDKSKDAKLIVEFLDDGNMVVRWDAPAVTREDTSLRIFINIVDKEIEPNLYKSYWIRQPTHLGMLIISSKAIEALQEDPSYQGFFEFGVQLRTNDNCNRSYSNVQRYYFE
jgi:hypothetical protein